MGEQRADQHNPQHCETYHAAIQLEEGAKEVYSYLDISSMVRESKVSPKGLEVGMQLQHDLFSGTGVLLLKQGAVFDENAIGAVQRCFMIDPFEQDICVLLKNDEPE